MKFKIKKYKQHIIKKYIKMSNFFLIYQGTNNKDFIQINQKLDLLDLKYYKTRTAITKTILKKSLHSNFETLFNNLTILIELKNKTTNLTLQKLIKLDDSLFLVAIKINKQYYPVIKIDSTFKFNFKKDSTKLIKLLKIQLKRFYKLI